MSDVATIIISVEQPNTTELNASAADRLCAMGFTELDNLFGGPKYPQSEIWGCATNYLDFPALLAEFRPPGRDSLCPSGASLVSTMAAPSGFCRGSGCEKKSFPVLRVSRY